MQDLITKIIQDPEFPEGEAWRRRSFKANETIVREGEEDRTMYLVESGSMRVSRRVELEDDRHIQPGLADLGPGDLFGELGLFESHARTASVVAIDHGVLVGIDCERLSQYLERHPELGYQAFKQLFMVFIDRLSRANQRVEQLFAWGLKVHGIDQHL
ncbi:MAG: cyclic nucleotide-binding domain-containing protein [Gammaproteobacteria bacterium]|nr:cyclic nucleotide-binding domain-containing protein [Gammaproteobacteria bacterium]